MIPIPPLARSVCSIVSVILIAFAYGMTHAQPGSSESTGEAPPPQIVVSEAYIRFVDRVTLAFQRSGLIAQLPVCEGDTVTADALIAKLEDAVARADLEIAKAEAASDVKVRVAQKEAETAQAEYQAVLNANKLTPGTFPEPDVLRLRLEAQRTALLVELKQHEYRIAQLTRDQVEAELTTYAVHAPFAALVTKTLKSAGEAVTQGEAVAELVSTRRVRVDGYIDLADAWRVRPGDRVEVRIAAEQGPSMARQPISGKLRFVDVSVQTLRSVIRVWAEVDNKDGSLRDGLTAEMTIFPTSQPKPGALRVGQDRGPAAAVVPSGM